MKSRSIRLCTLFLGLVFAAGCTASQGFPDDDSDGQRSSGARDDDDSSGDDTTTSGGSGRSGSSGSSGGSGSSSSGGSGSSGSGGSSSAGGAATNGDQGQGDGTDVVTIGDSYMHQFDPLAMSPIPIPIDLPTGVMGIELSLEKVSKRTYRKFGGTYPAGASPQTTPVGMLPPAKAIPDQFARALKEKAGIKTVVATGGGNDLTEDCVGAATENAISPACSKLADDVEAAIVEMTKDLDKAGVRDLVWVGYGHMDTAKMSQPKEVNGFLERLRTLRMKACKVNDPALKIHCYYVDTMAALEGKIGSDGQHPSQEGYDLMGQMVWDLMKAKGLRR